ncbi:MAG: hypothetical protein B6I36_06765, partial [Desulfobacteraceae bacterium 4572_35.1]
MTHSIIYKILFGLFTVIICIFSVSGYLFVQNDKELIADIREYNLNSAMEALDARLETSLQDSQRRMQDTTNMISKNSSLFLLNYDTEGLKESLAFDMERQEIKAIKIWDANVDQLFLLAYKIDGLNDGEVDGKIAFGEELPSTFANFTQLKK